MPLSKCILPADMSSSSEYNTLIELTGDLRVAVRSHLTYLSGVLLAKHLISPDDDHYLRNQLHSEADRAAKLIELIQNRVQQNPKHYNKFICVLQDGACQVYADILHKLDQVLQRHQCNGNSMWGVGLLPSIILLRMVLRSAMVYKLHVP